MTVPATQFPKEPPKDIIFEGGPLDGKSWAELDSDEAHVLMSDGQRHRYVRTTQIRELPNGLLAQVFDWAGRYYGAR